MHGFPIYIELENGTIIVQADRFARLARGEVLPPATGETALVSKVAQAINRTPKPTLESLLQDLDEVQITILATISTTVVANLRRNHFGLGVYGNLAIYPRYDEDYSFWISDLESGALIAVNPRMLEDARAFVNVNFSSLAFFDRLGDFSESQLERGIKIDLEDIALESYRGFGHRLEGMVQRLRRSNR